MLSNKAPSFNIIGDTVEEIENLCNIKYEGESVKTDEKIAEIIGKAEMGYTITHINGLEEKNKIFSIGQQKS